MIRLAAVSYLNARPLVVGLEREPGVSVVTDVPARLLDLLLDDRADAAPCPIVDYQTAPRDLVIVPGGAIGADGETLTVRLFARRPLDEVETVHVDPDSHTSVVLLRVLLAERTGRPGHRQRRRRVRDVVPGHRDHAGGAAHGPGPLGQDRAAPPVR